jgi:hypothetical protein
MLAQPKWLGQVQPIQKKRYVWLRSTHPIFWPEIGPIIVGPRLTYSNQLAGPTKPYI